MRKFISKRFMSEASRHVDTAVLIITGILAGGAVAFIGEQAMSAVASSALDTGLSDIRATMSPEMAPFFAQAVARHDFFLAYAVIGVNGAFREMHGSPAFSFGLLRGLFEISTFAAVAYGVPLWAGIRFAKRGIQTTLAIHTATSPSTTD